ncbi:hypothetical protein [Chitinimonas taiwanensis]|uniref:Uncharacterized protein n=1 Tax=Chitinimonas taiwanensis DSM 18899 TaxID=1121279 RepID=A0A1K2HMG5_9NEIS|nr:hypothetical protein [Chitinimonas taiwanensis]SFZ78016.1 hypothetical protein SAMN02745887_02723 [Chitinimonas taiwanensis DSM 18899]
MLLLTQPIDWKEPATTALQALQVLHPDHPALMHASVQKVALTYNNLPPEQGLAALGQALSALGVALYAVETGSDNAVFYIVPATMPPPVVQVIEHGGAACDARLQYQSQRRWGQKAVGIRAASLQLAIDCWDEGDAELMWLSERHMMWRWEAEALVADVTRWDACSTGIDHMIDVRFPGRSDAGDYTVRYAPLALSAEGAQALWALQGYATPDPLFKDKRVKRHAQTEILVALPRDEQLRCALPTVFPPALPCSAGALSEQGLPSPPQPAIYNPLALMSEGDGTWRLLAMVSKAYQKAPPLDEQVILILNAQFQLQRWQWVSSQPEAAAAFGFTQARSGMWSLTALPLHSPEIPGLPPNPSGWDLCGAYWMRDAQEHFVMLATSRDTGARFVRDCSAMQAKLGECRYSQRLLLVSLPHDWVLLDISGDNWGLQDSAWLWHVPSDRFLALPLGAIGENRENMDFHYQPQLESLFATNVSYDYSTKLFRLMPFTQMLSLLRASATLERRLPDWISVDAQIAANLH